MRENTMASSSPPEKKEKEKRRHSRVYKWYKYITQATQDQKGRDRLATHPPPTSSSSSNVPNRRSGSTVTPPRDTPSTQNTSTAPLSSSVPSSSSLPAEPDTPPPYPVHRDTTAESSDDDEDDEEHRLRKISNTGSDASGLHEGGEGRRRLSSGSSLDHVQHLEPQVAQQALIHPAEVVVTQQVLVQKADPVLTPYERLLQHDHHIEREMLEKKKLIAQMMQVSIKDFDHVAEMAREEKAEDSDARSLLLASIHMSSELNKQIHNSLTQCVTTSCVDGAAAPDTAAAIQLPQVLTSGQLVENTQKLEQKLQHLMHLVQEREAETERLQAELDAARHKLQELSPRPHTQKGFFSADSNNSFSQLNNTSDEDLVDGVKRQRNEFSIAKASVLHQVRVEHCETIKVSSSPPALQPPPPVVEARERAVSPIAVQHLTLATEEEQSEDSDTVTKDSEDSITKDSDEVVKDTNAIAKNSGDVSKDSVDSVATKSEDTAAGDKEEEDKSDNEKSEGKSEDSESESDSSDDDDDEEEGDEDEEEDDDEEEDEVEVRCDDGASILQETLTVPDIAYLEAVDSDDEEKDEVRLEITEDDTKNSGENKEKEGGETSL